VAEDGLEFWQRLRRGEFSEPAGGGTSPDVPVIILSAVALSSLADELDRGIPLANFVEKPFRLSELVEQMRRQLKG
jgi:CheY-like chemotaxis protein